MTPRPCGKSGTDSCEICVGSCGIEEEIEKKDITRLADKLAAAALEVSEAWDADGGEATDRLTRALVNLDEAYEDYTFVRREMAVRVAREPR